MENNKNPEIAPEVAAEETPKASVETTPEVSIMTGKRLNKKTIIIIAAVLAAAIIIAQFTFCAIINLSPVPYWGTFISAVGFFVFFGAYMSLTTIPLKQHIFKDPITGKYGFRAHRDFFKSHQKSHQKKHHKSHKR